VTMKVALTIIPGSALLFAFAFTVCENGIGK
jgi:hypothetical protein